MLYKMFKEGGLIVDGSDLEKYDYRSKDHYDRVLNSNELSIDQEIDIITEMIRQGK